MYAHNIIWYIFNECLLYRAYLQWRRVRTLDGLNEPSKLKSWWWVGKVVWSTVGEYGRILGVGWLLRW